MYEDGLPNDLIGCFCDDPDFNLERSEIEAVLNPINFTGCSVEQVEEFVENVIKSVLEENKAFLGEKAELNV